MTEINKAVPIQLEGLVPADQVDIRRVGIDMLLAGVQSVKLGLTEEYRIGRQTDTEPFLVTSRNAAETEIVIRDHFASEFPDLATPTPSIWEKAGINPN